MVVVVKKKEQEDLLCISASSDVAPDTKLVAISVFYQYVEITELLYTVRLLLEID